MDEQRTVLVECGNTVGIGNFVKQDFQKQSWGNLKANTGSWNNPSKQTSSSSSQDQNGARWKIENRRTYMPYEMSAYEERKQKRVIQQVDDLEEVKLTKVEPVAKKKPKKKKVKKTEIIEYEVDFECGDGQQKKENAEESKENAPVDQPAAVAVEAITPEEAAKKIKKLKKKLKDIENKKKSKSLEEMDDDEKKKVAQEGDILKEVAELEKIVS